MSYLVICGEHGCTRMTGHSNPKYNGPCHVCIEDIKKVRRYKYLLDKAAKNDSNNDEYSELEYVRADKWSF